MRISKFTTLVLVMAIAIASEASEPPGEVVAFRNAISSIDGISEVEIEKIYLPDVSVEDLHLPGSYADLPIAALRRSNGGLQNELLISAKFRIQRNEKGLKALEFLSWWSRDQSRSGKNIQVRAIGLPPIVGKSKQLGNTLRFSIEFFYSSPSQDLQGLLKAVGYLAKSIDENRELYRDAF